MHLLRPARPSDVGALIDLFTANLDRIRGISSLRPDEDRLSQRAVGAEAAFGGADRVDGGLDYFCVLEDAETGALLGTTATIAHIGESEPFYSFKMSTRVHRAAELDMVNKVQTLFLTNDYTGCTEIASLFLDRSAVGRGSGTVLSGGRFLLMAEHPDRFDDKVFAEMRGHQEPDGTVPFWNGLGQLFFPMTFEEADRRCALGQKGFIASMFPDHPIYVPLLPPTARAAIGRVHRETEPALRMLERQGFRWERYIDVFDGGATVEAQRRDIAWVRASRSCTVVDGGAGGAAALVATTDLAGFRCVRTEVGLADEGADGGAATITLGREAREVLGVETGAAVRAVLIGDASAVPQRS
jgi:arginine N-succinyltransferase